MNTISMKEMNTKMEAITSKLIVIGILSLLTIITGFIVSHSSKPYSIGLVTVHKLIAVGLVVLIGMAVKQLYGNVDGKVILEWSAIIVTGIIFLALIATGSLITREEMQLPEIVFKIHQVAPYLALASSAATIYLLVGGKS